eukprot:gene17184-20439_t
MVMQAPVMTLVVTLFRPALLIAITGDVASQAFRQDLDSILDPILAMLVQMLRLTTAELRLEDFVIDVDSTKVLEEVFETQRWTPFRSWGESSPVGNFTVKSGDVALTCPLSPPGEEDLEGWKYGEWAVDLEAFKEVDADGWCQFNNKVDFPPPANSKNGFGKVMRRRRWLRVRVRQSCIDDCSLDSPHASESASAFSDDELIQRYAYAAVRAFRQL